MKNILIISALAGVLALSSCWRDDLYYATVDRATVRIEADWTPARLTPNGVSAFVLDSNGAAFDVVRSNDSRKVDLSLPEGSYSVVVLNNTLDEYRNIESAGTDRLETFALMGRAVSPNFTTLGGGTRAESFIGEPDTVAGSVVRNIEVTRKMIEYFRTKPHGMEPAPAAVYQTAPTRIISVADIRVHVKGLKYAAGAPRTHLKNLSGGYYLDSDKPHSLQVCHEFVLNNKRVDPDNYKLATITKQLISFGPEKANGKCLNDHQLVMNFILVNGETHTVSLNVKDLIETSHDGVQTVHKIRAEVTLPEAIGNGDGVFHPEVEEWEEIETELPI